MAGKLKRSKHRGELRSGFTTGACAAAAAKAATHVLIYNEAIDTVEITLPNGCRERFELHCLHIDQQHVLACVIKDGGDDPDCTHGLEIQCIARWSNMPGVQVTGGVGVARVTLPGLELPVGEAAINPVPRKNIREMVLEELGTATPGLFKGKGIAIEVCVPKGEEAAKETINHRLGLLGGISILGTRGTVRPYSTSAFASSVRQSIQIAKANGIDHVVLTTGSRSERSAMNMLPDLPDTAFIQAGDFLGVGMRAAKRYGISRLTVVAMVGKMGKLVSGHMMTHVSGHAVDFDFLAELAEKAGLSTDLSKGISKANTVRHVLDMARLSGDPVRCNAFLNLMCEETHRAVCEYITDALDVDIRLIDFDGTLLAQHPVIDSD